MPLPEVAAALGSQRKPAWGAPVVIWLVMLGMFPKLEMFIVVPPKNRFIEIAELPEFIFHQVNKLEHIELYPLHFQKTSVCLNSFYFEAVLLIAFIPTAMKKPIIIPRKLQIQSSISKTLSFRLIGKQKYNYRTNHLKYGNEHKQILYSMLKL